MFKVMIVDDELSILEGLKRLLNWNALGFNVTYLASDGAEAYEAWKKIQPQLVITDIKMPEMDGLELSRLLKEADPNIEIIIISGYKDFTYAKEAIKHGVKSYILKPVDEEELTLEVKRIGNILREKLPFFQEDMKLSWRLEWDNTRLFSAVENCNRVEIERELTRLFSLFLKNRAPLIITQSIIGDIVSFLWGKAAENNCDISDACQNVIRESIKLSDDGYMDTVKKNLYNICMAVCDAIVAKKNATLVAEKITEIEKYLQKHYSEPLSLKYLSKKYHINHVYLGQIFRKKTGSSFNDYLNKVRMENAVKLIIETNLSLSEIAYKTGYTNQVSFYRNFKKLYGVNPCDIRRRANNK